MKLKSLDIKRFGARSNLQLDALSEHLNVIHGPNGSGKSTLIQCLRWILFGNIDSQSDRFLAACQGRAEGSARVTCDGRDHVLARRDDGTRTGQTWPWWTGRPPEGTAWRAEFELPPAPATRAEPRELDHIFTVDCERPEALRELIATAGHRGIDVMHDPRQLEEIARLRARADQLRELIRQHVDLEGELSGLQQRRHVVVGSIERLKDDRRRWEEQWLDQREQLRRQIAETTADRDRVAATVDRQYQAAAQLMLRIERQLDELIEQFAIERRASASGATSTWSPAPWWLAPSTSSDEFLDAAPMSFGALGPAARSMYPRPTESLGAEPWLARIESRINHLRAQRDEHRALFAEHERRLEEFRRELDGWEVRRHQSWDTAQLDRWQEELQQLDARIRAAHDQLRLRQELAGVEDSIGHLRRSLRESEVLIRASEHLRALTRGTHSRIRVSHDDQVWVDDGQQQWLALERLSRGTRDQVHLSLSLALADCYRTLGIELPVLLNDVFAHIDSQGAVDAAAVLDAFARRGHQVIVFTRHQHVLQLFRPLGAQLFLLKPRSASEHWTGPIPDAMPVPAVAEVESVLGAEPRHHWVARWRDPVTVPPANGRSASRSAPVSTTVTLPAATVADATSPAPRRDGPLTELETQLLIGCGIDSVAMLASLEVDAVARRIDAYLSNPQVRRAFGQPSDYSRARIARWIEAARSHARAQAATPGAATDHDMSAERPPRLYRQKSEHDQPASPRLDTQRYFLDPRDGVVEAPSIGPKTAELLRGLGIETIGELLAAHADDVAKQLGQPRISADHVRQWQYQARMVCRVPNLRGHDSQILVACGVSDAEQLAAADPLALWQRVDQFCASTEGKRVLRNSRKPDQQLVADWVRWARAARQLRAA